MILFQNTSIFSICGHPSPRPNCHHLGIHLARAWHIFYRHVRCQCFPRLTPRHAHRLRLPGGHVSQAWLPQWEDAISIGAYTRRFDNTIRCFDWCNGIFLIVWCHLRCMYFSSPFPADASDVSFSATYPGILGMPIATRLHGGHVSQI